VLAAVLWWLVSTQLRMGQDLFFSYSDAQWVAEHLIFPLVGLLLALPAAFGDPRRGLPRRILGHRLLAWFGLVSYGVFLWHQPLMAPVIEHGGDDLIPGMPFPSLLLTLGAVSVAIAAASYYLVERPILRFKDRRRPTTATAPVPQREGVPASVG
jgi:peptidoglycan/LPS O-acetylase OafA/YrhL